MNWNYYGHPYSGSLLFTRRHVVRDSVSNSASDAEDDYSVLAIA